MKAINTRRVSAGRFDKGLPFCHLILDELFLPEFCLAVADAFPPMTAEGWVHYDNPLEKKSVFNDRFGEPEIVQKLYDILSSDGFLDLLEQMTEIPGLGWDDSLHAAGLCATGNGGKLDLHRDADTHPETGACRALTAVLFLNDCDPAYGGALEFWSERDSKPFERHKLIEPKCGRLVLFDPNGFHGYPDRIVCPAGTYRKSVQVFYWTSKETTGRMRASFFPRPGEAHDTALDELRLARGNHVLR